MELKDVLAYLGLDEKIDSIDKLKTEFTGKFITRADADSDPDIRSKVSGHMMGGLTTEAKNLFGFTAEEIKDKDMKTILKMGVEKKNLAIKTLEDSHEKPEERYTKLKKEYDTLSVQANQYKSDLDTAIQTHTQEKQNLTSEIMAVKKGVKYNEIKSKLPWSDNTKEVERIGFDAVVAGKYNLDLDDKGNLTITHKDGKKVSNPDKAGEYLNPEQVLDMELTAQGLKKQNNNPGGPVRFGHNEDKRETGGNEYKGHVSSIAKNHTIVANP